MTEWRRLAPVTGGRDPAAVLALMQRAALANRRIRERSQEIAATRSSPLRARRDGGAEAPIAHDPGLHTTGARSTMTGKERLPRGGGAPAKPRGWQD